jgi:acyl carrier protein
MNGPPSFRAKPRAGTLSGASLIEGLHAGNVRFPDEQNSLIQGTLAACDDPRTIFSAVPGRAGLLSEQGAPLGLQRLERGGEHVDAQVRDQLREFISTNYLFGDSDRLPGDDASLIETGVVDSTGILEMIEFLEDRFGIEVAEDETIEENLGSVSALTRFVLAKASTSAATSL